MTDETTPIIAVADQPSERSRFPIVFQLSILAIILIAVFGSMLFNGLTHAEPLPPENYAAPKPLPPIEPEAPQKLGAVSITAKAAYIWDVRAQRALYSQRATDAMPIASITKLMTSLLAYELIEENSHAEVTLSAIRQEGSSGLLVGEEFTIKDLQEMALISSSNDAAYAMAANVGALLGENDPASQFVTGMNIRADELDLYTLDFKNPTGLDISTGEAGAVGSARDISFLVEYILEHYPEILTPTTESATRVYNVSGAYHEVENTNDVLEQIPNLIGSKTGYTDLAGGNLTVAFDLGYDRPIIVTVLGSTRQERFADVLTLVQAVQATIKDPEE